MHVQAEACRYCLVDSGDLVAPCECKGSGQWVHLGCLRQWQKSVLLTQSTHPKYQTRIDEICIRAAFCLFSPFLFCGGRAEGRGVLFFLAVHFFKLV